MADMSYFDSRPKVFEEIAEQVSDRFIDAEAIQFITCVNYRDRPIYRFTDIFPDI